MDKKHCVYATLLDEIARRTGLSPSTISRVNSGAISPSFEVVEKISKAVGLKIQILPDEINSMRQDFPLQRMFWCA